MALVIELKLDTFDNFIAFFNKQWALNKLKNKGVVKGTAEKLTPDEDFKMPGEHVPKHVRVAWFLRENPDWKLTVPKKEEVHPGLSKAQLAVLGFSTSLTLKPPSQQAESRPTKQLLGDDAKVEQSLKIMLNGLKVQQHFDGVALTAEMVTEKLTVFGPIFDLLRDKITDADIAALKTEMEASPEIVDELKPLYDLLVSDDYKVIKDAYEKLGKDELKKECKEFLDGVTTLNVNDLIQGFDKSETDLGSFLEAVNKNLTSVYRGDLYTSRDKGKTFTKSNVLTSEFNNIPTGILLGGGLGLTGRATFYDGMVALNKMGSDKTPQDRNKILWVLSALEGKDNLALIDTLITLWANKAKLKNAFDQAKGLKVRMQELDPEGAADEIGKVDAVMTQIQGIFNKVSKVYDSFSKHPLFEDHPDEMLTDIEIKKIDVLFMALEMFSKRCKAVSRADFPNSITV